MCVCESHVFHCFSHLDGWFAEPLCFTANERAGISHPGFGRGSSGTSRQKTRHDFPTEGEVFWEKGSGV